MYLQLVDGSNRDIVFKVKFNGLQSRREFLVARLLNAYLYFDKNKFLPIAQFWLYLLKVNGFLGEKRGYLSGTTYLLMFVNYMQQQC